MTESLSSRVAQFESDIEIAHRIVHGTAEESVETEGGQVRTFAKIQADYDAEMVQSETNQNRVAAEAAASAAVVARDEAQLAAGIFPTIAAGLAATVDNEYFSVPSPESDEYLILYRHSGAEALEQRRYPAAGRITALETRTEAAELEILELEKRTPSIQSVLAGSVPIVVTDSGQVSLWLEDGKLNAAGVSASFVEKIRAGLDLDAALLELAGEIGAVESRLVIKAEPAQPGLLPVAVTESGQVGLWLEGGDLAARGMAPHLRAQAVIDVITRSASVAGVIPLMHDAGGKVALWLDGGMLGAKGLTPRLIQIINDAFPISNYAPRNAPVSTSLPLCTDGRSLFKWRAKRGQILAGDTSAKLRIGFTGDSWTEFVTIPQQFRQLLEGQISNAGEGWQSVNKTHKLNGVVFTWTGWTYLSGNTIDVGETPTGIDGKVIYTTSTAAVAELSNIQATDITLYYRNTTGTFRYSVDGGSWVSVTGTGDNSLGTVTISGLADTVHTLNIDTAGNAGTVYLFGFYATRNVGGVEIMKMGNGGQTGQMMRKWIPHIQAIAQTLDIDLLIVVLGTNDYRTVGATVAEYVAALSELVAAYRSATPDLGFAFVAPADSDGFAVTPLTEYRDALYKFCIDNGHEFFNLYDMFGTFEQSNALSQWVDDLHLNSNGAVNFVNEFNHQFLHIAGA